MAVVNMMSTAVFAFLITFVFQGIQGISSSDVSSDGTWSTEVEFAVKKWKGEESFKWRYCLAIVDSLAAMELSANFDIKYWPEFVHNASIRIHEFKACFEKENVFNVLYCLQAWRHSGGADSLPLIHSLKPFATLISGVLGCFFHRDNDFDTPTWLVQNVYDPTIDTANKSACWSAVDVMSETELLLSESIRVFPDLVMNITDAAYQFKICVGAYYDIPACTFKVVNALFDILVYVGEYISYTPTDTIDKFNRLKQQIVNCVSKKE